MSQNYDIDRKAEANVNPLFIERWSPRAFKSDFKINSEQIEQIFEAARWAPSSYNEQPWTFLYATNEDSQFSDFVDLLVEANQKWAKHASLLCFIISKKTFSKTGDDNPVHVFDCGSAWLALTLQARKLGLYTHGMAGIKKEEVYKKLNVNKDTHEVICAFALGKKGDPSQLPEDFAKLEKPNSRKPLHEIFKKGKMS